MDGELPPASQVSARCYGSGNLWTVADTLEYTVNIADCGDNLPIGRRDNHGTLVAQAVVDMAEGLDWFVQELLENVGNLNAGDAEFGWSLSGLERRC